MVSFARATALALLLLAPPVGAEDAGTGERISVEFRGTLGDALRQIAQRGNLSLIATGPLQSPAEVHLTDVTALEAIRAVAEAHQLEVSAHERVITLRPRAQDKSTSVAASRGPLRHAGGERVQTGDVVIEANEAVDGAVAFGGDVTVDGRVEGDATALGGQVRVNGSVTGDAVALGGSVELGPSARVDGDVVALGGTVVKAEGAVVRGETTRLSSVDFGASLFPHLSKTGSDDSDDAAQERESRPIGMLLELAAWFTLLFAVGFGFVVLAPNRLREVAIELWRKPVQCGVTGLLALIALVPLTLMLIVTGIGIVVAAGLWLLLPIAMALGIAAGAIQLAGRIPPLRGRRTQALLLAVGLAIILLAAQVPAVGTVAFGLLTLVGFGAILRTRLGSRASGLPEPL